MSVIKDETNKSAGTHTAFPDSAAVVDSLTDININPSTLPPPDDAVGAPKQSKRTKTGGETLFDRVVYSGIGFGANELSALVIGDQFEHGVGKNLYAKTREWIAKTFKIAGKIGRNGKQLTPYDISGNYLLTLTLLTSGSLLVWPMKALEDNKEYWVKKANHFLDSRKGNLSEEQVAARDKEVEQAIACEPKQSWPTLIAGRLTAMGATMLNSGKIMGPERMEKAGHFSENLLTRGKFSTQRIGKEGDQRNALHRYANLIGIETICCAISSVTLELTSKFLSKLKPQVHNAELCAAEAPTATGAPVASGNASSDTDMQEKTPAAFAHKTLRADNKDLDSYKKNKPGAALNHAELAIKGEQGHFMPS